MGSIVISASTVSQFLVGSAAVAAAIMILWGVTVRPAARGWRKVDRLYDDWAGTPARPGFRAVPGFPERLALVEDEQRAMGELIRLVASQVVTNGGTSLRDEIKRIEAQVRVGAIHQGVPVLPDPNAPPVLAVQSPPPEWPLNQSGQRAA